MSSTEGAKGKKKVKKAPKVVAVVTPDGIEGSFLAEPRRPLIAHLHVSSSEIQFHDMPIQYDPNPPTQPEPYDAVADDIFGKHNAEILVSLINQESTTEPAIEETLPSAAAPVPSPSPQQEKTLVKPLEPFYKASLMVQYRDCLASQKLPTSSDSACFWCAHTFEGMPCVIPEREEKGIYRVYGNFCCPECGLAYLLSESLDTHVRWERMALLQRIYIPTASSILYPAPPRESLKMFGGTLDIETYRATVRGGKVRVDLQMPPMVSILGSIDTKPIDFYNSSLRNTISPLLNESVGKAEEGLRLRRTKPLKDKESTLDAVMNIQIRSKRGQN